MIKLNSHDFLKKELVDINGGLFVLTYRTKI